MPELCSDVWVPQEPLENEHSQTQGVAVALQGDQLAVDCLGMSRRELVTYRIQMDKHTETCSAVVPRAQSAATVDCMTGASLGLFGVRLKDNKKMV